MPQKLEARTLARANGEKTYDTGLPCIKGHVAPRYTSTAGCVECARIYNSDSEAKRVWSKRHYLANREEIIKDIQRRKIEAKAMKQESASIHH